MKHIDVEKKLSKLLNWKLFRGVDDTTHYVRSNKATFRHVKFDIKSTIHNFKYQMDNLDINDLFDIAMKSKDPRVVTYDSIIEDTLHNETDSYQLMTCSLNTSISETESWENSTTLSTEIKGEVSVESPVCGTSVSFTKSKSSTWSKANAKEQKKEIEKTIHLHAEPHSSVNCRMIVKKVILSINYSFILNIEGKISFIGRSTVHPVHPPAVFKDYNINNCFPPDYLTFQINGVYKYCTAYNAGITIKDI